MVDVVDPIFPRRYVPPYLREQAAVEETVREQEQIAGRYGGHALDGIEASFYDRRAARLYRVRFNNGVIYVRGE